VIERGGQFRALDQPAMNTADTYGRFLLGILANVAELERDLILSRTKEGRKRFLANGGKLGRKAKLSPTQIKTART
jgi:DNA invertase Pin-like site-specific DNA recombinase